MSCPEFVAESLALGTAIRLHHLLATSYSQHIALNEFYTAQSDLVDAFAEVAIGIERRPTSYPSMKPPTGSPTELLSDYLLEIQEEAGECEYESLKNLLAELEALTARTLYKLKHLK